MPKINSVGWHTYHQPPCTKKYIQVHTSTYQYILSCTSLYCSLYHCVPLCTWLYLLVPLFIVQYIQVHTCMYCHRNVIGQYSHVCTGMYNFAFSRTASYPEEDVLVRTRTYLLVLPCTRGTGFQMETRFLAGPSCWSHSSLMRTRVRVTQSVLFRAPPWQLRQGKRRPTIGSTRLPPTFPACRWWRR